MTKKNCRKTSAYRDGWNAKRIAGVYELFEIAHNPYLPESTLLYSWNLGNPYLPESTSWYNWNLGWKECGQKTNIKKELNKGGQMRFKIEFEGDNHTDCPAYNGDAPGGLCCVTTPGKDRPMICPGPGQPGCPAVEVEKCRVTYKFDELCGCNCWFTSCGHFICITEKKYCPYCGREIEVVK